MILNYLEIENWKCFLKKKIFKFKEHELINARNGTGKSSLFEAIFFAITGKTPVGFNLNTIRNNDSKPCYVYVEFTHNGDEISVKRAFGDKISINNMVELNVNGKLIAESIRSIDKFFESIFNSKIISILWTANLVSSDTLSAKFFANAILEDVLSQPNTILAHFTGEIYRANREINKLDNLNSSSKELLDLNKINSEIDELQSKLKNKGNIVKKQVSLARLAQEAGKTLIQLEEQGVPNCVDGVDIVKFKRLYRNYDKLNEDLKKEMLKCNSIYSSFNINEIKKILQVSLKNNTCIICGGNFDEKHKESIEHEISLSGRSEMEIERILNDIKLIESCTIEKIQLYEKWQEAKKCVDSCPNYEEIINQWDNDNNLLWKRFDELQKLKIVAQKQMDEIKYIEKLRIKISNWKTKSNIIKGWIDEATHSYTQKLMSKASQYLNSINNRYKQIAIYGKEFVVVVENDENFSLNMLPVARLSNGEKTMCSLSILFAIHNIFVPDIPLLFDETFSALDKENLEQVQRFLAKQKTQIFVITHDQTWEEF